MPKRESDESVIRLLEFIDYLRAHPEEHKVVALAEHFGVARQQIYRWAQYATDRYGLPIDRSPLAARGSIRLGEGDHEVKRVTLDRIEVEALLAAVSRIESLTPYAKEALYKLEDAQRIPDDALEQPILHTPLADQYDQNLFERTVKAIRDLRVAELHYQNAKGEQKVYKFNSYALIAGERHIYLVGVSHNSLEAGFETVIRLRLDEVKAFVLQREHFRKPGSDAFDMKAYAAREFGPFSAEGDPVTVRVKFSKEKARYITRTFRHETQSVTKYEDGVIWEVTVPLTEDLVYWIVSYGPHATVLEPPELKEQVLEWARGSLDANS